MDHAERLRLIDRYEQGAHLFAEALREVPERLLDTPTAPGKWTIRQIALHTVDAEIVFSVRFRMLGAQDGAPILMFDQDSWAANLEYRSQPIDHAQALFVTLRHTNTAMLRALPESAWKHTGTHAKRGPMTMDDVLKLSIGHGESHAESIRQAHQKLSATAA
ncbi:MAG TPA: DinB family protein [candidate division Zixibacteria bacterium]|nr:DinB family protein [candidate division Zixibacteria bacterium]